MKLIVLPLALLSFAYAQTNVGQISGKVFDTSGAIVPGVAISVLSPDTGLMHIAAALRKPIVVVWGSTVPRFGMYPFYPTGMARHTSMEVPGLPCRPCSKLGYPACPRGHFRCMQDQSDAGIRMALEG